MKTYIHTHTIQYTIDKTFLSVKIYKNIVMLFSQVDHILHINLCTLCALEV